MEVSHPHPILNEILVTTEALLRRTPLFRLFCEKLSVVPSADGHALRADFRGPGTFEFHAEMRLPHEHVWADVPRSGMLEKLLHDAEEGFVQLYEQHLAKQEQPAPAPQPAQQFKRLEEVEPGTPGALPVLIRELVYNELLSEGLTEAEALEYIKTSLPPRIVWKMPEAAPAPVPTEPDPEVDELWP